jgi:hypothetical protein
LSLRRILRLCRGRARVLIVFRRMFRRRSRVLDSARAAVVRHMIRVSYNSLLHNRLVRIRCVDIRLIHVHHSRVVGEVPTSPLPACKADPAVAVSIVHAAVVTHVPAPVASMKSIPAAVPSPVGRRPESAEIWRRNPHAWHPVVVPFIVRIRPIAGCPHQVWLGANWLHIHGQRRGRKPDINTDAHLRMQRCSGNRHQKSKQNETHGSKQLHEQNPPGSFKPCPLSESPRSKQHWAWGYSVRLAAASMPGMVKQSLWFLLRCFANVRRLA